MTQKRTRLKHFFLGLVLIKGRHYFFLSLLALSFAVDTRSHASFESRRQKRLSNVTVLLRTDVDSMRFSFRALPRKCSGAVSDEKRRQQGLGRAYVSLKRKKKKKGRRVVARMRRFRSRGGERVKILGDIRCHEYPCSDIPSWVKVRRRCAALACRMKLPFMKSRRAGEFRTPVSIISVSR